MSFFGEVNKDAATSVPLDRASFGPRHGFLEALDAAWDAQARNSSMFGLEAAFREVEQDQIRSLRAAGITPHKSLNDSEEGETFGGFTGGVNSRRYLDAARFYVDGGVPETADMMAARDAEITKLQEKHPDLKLRTYRDMWNAVRDRASKADQIEQEGPTSIGGSVGGFVGAAIGGVDPRTDPLNTLTLPLGAGRTVAQRIGAQAFGQSAVETVNQLTGVRENRRLLGLDNSVMRSALEIGFAGVAGAGFQGLGEAAGALGRRWFRNTPTDPAPPPPARPTTGVVEPEAPVPPPERYVRLADEDQLYVAPARNTALDSLPEFLRQVEDANKADLPYGNSRVANRRSVLDLEAVTKQLDDFSTHPWEVKPSTETRPVDLDAGTQHAYDAPAQRVIDNQKTVDQLARELDPETFNIYDQLRFQRDMLRQWLTDLKGPRSEAATAAVRDADTHIAQLESKLEKTSPKNRKKVAEALAAARREREEIFEALTTADTPDMMKVRERIQALDEQMRDMAPVVTRAYDAARGKFAGHQPDPEVLEFLTDLEKSYFPLRRESVAPRTANYIPDPTPPTLAERVPILAARADVVSKLPSGSDAADAIKAIAVETAKENAELVTASTAKITEAVKMADEGTVTVIKSDKAAFTNAKGEFDITAANNVIVSQIERSLQAGAKVDYITEGKPRHIVAVDRGMMKDDKGQRWGLLGFHTDAGERIEIKTPLLELPGGKMIALDEKLNVPTLDGTGTRTVTVRDLLNEANEDKEIGQAVGTCRLS